LNANIYVLCVIKVLFCGGNGQKDLGLAYLCKSHFMESDYIVGCGSEFYILFNILYSSILYVRYFKL